MSDNRSWKSNGVDEQAWQRRGPGWTSSTVGWGPRVRRRGRKCRWKGRKRMSVKRRAGADRPLDLLGKSDSRQEEVNGGVVSELEVQVGRVSGGVGHSVEELVEVDGSERRSKRSGKIVAEERQGKIVSALLEQSVEAEGRTRKRSWQMRKCECQFRSFRRSAKRVKTHFMRRSSSYSKSRISSGRKRLEKGDDLQRLTSQSRQYTGGVSETRPRGRTNPAFAIP